MKALFKRVCSVVCAIALVASTVAVVSAVTDTDYSADYTAIIKNWEETLIGTSEDLSGIDYSNLDDSNPVDSKIITITETAQTYLDGIAKPEGEFANGDEAVEYWNNLIYPGDTSAIWNTNAEEGTAVHELSGYIWEDIAPAPQASRSQFAQVTSAVKRIQAMAMGYRVGNFTAEEKENLKNYILWTTEFVCEEWYALDTVRYGNWHDWNVGIPLALSNVLVLLYDETIAHIVDEQGTNLMQLVLTSINNFPPTHTMLGANLNWRSTINMLRGALAGSIGLVFDSTEGYETIQTALSGFEDVASYVTSDDGFYESDGSFIQHHMYAYTGSYGGYLIYYMSQSILALSGSSFEITADSEVNNMYENIFKAYEPVLVNGQVMEMVYGRSVAASGSTGGYDGGGLIMSGIVRLAKAAEISERDDAAKIKLLAKVMLQEITSQEVAQYYDYYANSDFAVVLDSLEILNDQTVDVEDYQRTDNTNVFYNMDRVVQHNDTYSVGLSMHSKRISAYESINGNNTKGWFQGSGMLYTYTDDYSKYTDHYWYTIDSYRLPGTTVLRGVDALPREDGDQNALGQNSYAGGTSIGDYSIAGMLLYPVNQTLNAKKSWFMFDDEIVALGSGITANEGTTIETTVENIKLLDDNSNTFIIDGTTQDSTLVTDGTAAATAINSWAYVSGNTEGSSMGYYFPESANVNTIREARTGNHYQINPGSTADDKTNHTKNYLTMYYDHGANGTTSDSYAYVILPAVQSADAVSSYASSSDITVLANTEDVQAVAHNDGIVGANFWNFKEATVQKDGEEYITANAPCSVMVADDGETLTVSVSDPTQENTEKFYIEINIGDKAVKIDTANTNEDITVLSAEGKVVLCVDPTSAAGSKGETKTAVLTFADEVEAIEYAAPAVKTTTFFATEDVDSHFTLDYTGSYPATFTLSVAEDADDTVLDYISTDRFGKLYVAAGLDLGDYDLTLAVSNTDADGETATETYDITVTVLKATKSKTPSKSVVYYDFNEGYGTAANSVSNIVTIASTMDFNATLSDSVEWVEGFVGTAVKFDSISDTLTLNKVGGYHEDSLGMNASKSTFGGATEYDFWVKFDKEITRDQVIFSKGGNTVPYAVKVTAAGKLGICIRNNWYYSDVLDWNAGEWYHVNITNTYDSTAETPYGITLKRDGNIVGTGSYTTVINGVKTVLSINNNTNTGSAKTTEDNYFEGTIDELYLGKAGGGEEIRLRSKVTFDTGDTGVTVSPQYPYLNETATEPADPECDGYKFLGWVDADGKEFDFSTEITTDITVYAAWEVDKSATMIKQIETDLNAGSYSVVYYGFNEGKGTTANTISKIKTSSAQDFSGELSESVEWVDGFVGSAVKFDSIGDTLTNDGNTGTNADSIGLDPTKSNFDGATAYDFWVKFDEDPTTRDAEQWIISRGSSSATSNIPWAVKVTTDGKIGFIRNKGAATASNWVFSDALKWNVGEWYHITVKHESSGTATIIRDGMTVGSGTSDTAATAINRAMYINGGAHLTANTAKYFNGTIDELYLGKASGLAYVNVRHKVTYVTNGGSDVLPEYVWENDKALLAAEPTKSGFTFAGWYTDADLTTAYNSDTAVTSDTVLYAAWESDVSVENIEISKDTFFVGESLELDVTATPEDVDTSLIVWSTETDGVTVNGNVITSTVTGEITVTATVAGGNADGSDYTKNFTITVTNYGDVDYDGDIDTNDYTLMRAALLGKNTAYDSASPKAYDANKDGKVDIRDLVTIS